MSLTILDLMLVVGFGFGKTFPTWLWVLALLDVVGYSIRIEKITKAIAGR